VDALASDFDAFVRARTPALLRSAYLLTGDQHLAEDLVQSALGLTHRAWRNLHATGNAEAYTRKTMYHLQVSRWRRRRVAESFAGEVPDRPGPQSDHAEHTVLRLSLRTALSRLTPKQRAVVVLRFFDDLTEAQAAETLGVSVGTIKSQTAKALERLRVLAPELDGVTVTGDAR
jgi:RNA polymerase sigma-70 factor (sigma-E family)